MGGSGLLQRGREPEEEMREESIAIAATAAQRFLNAADALRQAEAKDAVEHNGYVNCPRERGALRRASMDLTRALAEMRRP